MQPQLFAAGAAAWQAGHAALRSGTLEPTLARMRGDGEFAHLLDFAAGAARDYLQRVEAGEAITNNLRLRLFGTYVHAFINGVLDAGTNDAAPEAG